MVELRPISPFWIFRYLNISLKLGEKGGKMPSEINANLCASISAAQERQCPKICLQNALVKAFG